MSHYIMLYFNNVTFNRVIFKLGRSQEDIHSKHSDSDDEFEQSLEEILERELDIDSDKEITKAEVRVFLTYRHFLQQINFY